MNTRLLSLAVCCAFALAACSKEAPPAPAAAKKEDARPDAGRPMPPAAPTAAPAEGDNAAKKDEPKK